MSQLLGQSKIDEECLAVSRLMRQLESVKTEAIVTVAGLTLEFLSPICGQNLKCQASSQATEEGMK